MQVAAGDLSSTVLAERRAELPDGASAADALDAAARLAGDVVAEARLDRGRIFGAAMALPGPVGRAPGSLLRAWARIDAAAELARRLGVPVEIDNDANLGALGELSFGAARGLQEVIYVKVSWGIGAGIVVGGRVYHGATGSAGELGQVQVDPDGAVCLCGNRGCLGTVASAGPLLELLRPAYGEDLTLAGMLDLVASGDPGVQRAVNDAGRAIGRALGALCNSLNPAAIVVGGEVAAAGPVLVDGIRDALSLAALPAAVEAATVTVGALGDRASLLGALTLVIGDAERLRSTGLTAVGA